MPVVCLMPTYRKPLCVAQSVRMFLDQDYEGEVWLYIYDDDGWFEPSLADFGNKRVVIDVVSSREPSIGQKYNKMVRRLWALFKRDFPLVVWDDDDLYHANHVSSYARLMPARKWVHPHVVESDYGGAVHLEHTFGRFHGALGLMYSAWEEVGGWVEDQRADFDQEMIRRLRAKFGPPGEPGVTYRFRWATAPGPHCEGLMGDPDWYKKVEEHHPKPLVGPRTIGELLSYGARELEVGTVP